MKKFPAVVIGGLVAMLLTIVLYFTILGNVVLTVIHFISLAAILVSEGIATFCLWRAKGSPRVIAAGVVSVALVPYSVILSAVYILNFPEGYLTYLGWYAAGVLVFTLLAFTLMRFDANRQEENAKLQDAKGNMLMLRKLVKCVLADPAAEPYAQRLNALEENLHFSNDAVICPVDAKIQSMLMELQENIANAEYNVDEALTKLEKAVDTRKIMASRNV